MKKYLLLLAAFGLFFFSSCSSDDDSTTDQEKIIGTWFLVEANNFPGFTINECNKQSNITFKADNSASTEFFTNVEEQCVSDTDENSTWSKSGSKYTFQLPTFDDPVTGTVTFNTNTKFTFVPDIFPAGSLVFEK